MCDDVTVSFNSIEVCARFANGQLEMFTSGNASAVGGAIEIAVPYTASPQLQTTAAQAAGKILVIQRGASTFQDKAERAQAAGAVGAIIVNNVAGDPIVMPGNYTAVRIPVVMVPLSANATLQASQGLRLTIAAKREGAAGTTATLRSPSPAPRLTPCCLAEPGCACSTSNQTGTGVIDSTKLTPSPEAVDVHDFIGCGDHREDGNPFCYVRGGSDGCRTATPSRVMPGTAFRDCSECDCITKGNLEKEPIPADLLGCRNRPGR